jgi:hypothetical protein
MANLKARFATLSLAAFVGFTSTGAQAGPYGDDLGRCLVSSTSSLDKRAMVKWLLATAAMHPDVQPLAVVSTQQRDNLNKAVGTLFERLLSQSCRQQAVQAFNFEGLSAIEHSFQILGQVAARELFADPTVVAGMAEVTKQEVTNQEVTKQEVTKQEVTKQEVAKHADSRKSVTAGRKSANGPRNGAAPSVRSKVTR